MFLTMKIKKYCAIFVTLALLITAFLPLLPASAASPTASLSGPSVLRAGDTLTVTLKLSGTNLRAAEGKITYDTGKLTYSSAKELASGWSIEFTSKDGSIGFLGIDDKMNAPINKETKLLSVTFKVKSSLSSGTSVKVNTTNLAVSDGTSDFPIADAQYKISISPPKSSVATLSKLSAAEVSLTPEFAPDVTEYTAPAVPFEISALTLSYKTSNAAASVTVQGNDLQVGENTVLIKVTAENGNEKIYSILVEREQDPNYIPSADATLSDLTVSVGQLSPAFSPDTFLYLVTVPYEVTSVTISGTPNDPLAIGCTDQVLLLDLGENFVIFFNMAEDGSQLAYTVNVIRMPKYEGYLPTVIPGTEPPPPTEPQQTEDPSQTEPTTAGIDASLPATDTQTDENTASKSDSVDQTIFLISLGAVAIVMLGIGLCIGILCAKPKKYKYKK